MSFARYGPSHLPGGKSAGGNAQGLQVGRQVSHRDLVSLDGLFQQPDLRLGRVDLHAALDRSIGDDGQPGEHDEDHEDQQDFDQGETAGAAITMAIHGIFLFEL